MSRIVFVSPYRDLSVLAQSVAQELGLPVEFYEGWLERAGEVVDRLMDHPIDILMSRGGTAEYLAERYNIPVIRVNAGPYDMIECIDEARRYSPNIAYTLFDKPFNGTRLLEKVMNVNITEVIFSNLNELERKIAALANRGNYCVVGGGPSVSYATQYGLPAVFSRTSRETLREAFLRAEEMAKIQKEEKRRAKRLKTILDSAYDGIIAVDGDGKVEIFNHAAERIMQMNAVDVLGKQVADVIPNTRLKEVLQTGQKEIGEIQEINDIKIATNRVPVQHDNEIMGAVATFQELKRVMQVERQVRKELTGRGRFKTRFNFSDIVADSTIMQEKKQLARNFARSDLTVLIYGASGTGKELFAQSIHNASSRSAHPFVAVNCGALPPTLLESELFGYEEGAFTGARRKGKHGLFELAHGGTLFLDEIDALPVELQGRLLRVLQEREVLRVGGEAIIPVDIRVIAATNQQPLSLLKEKKIREDLFYRLNVLYLELPPLKDRKQDIDALARRFLPEGNCDKFIPVVEELLPYLKRYSWPGNIRELSNFIQRLVFFIDTYDAKRGIEELIKTLAPNLLEQPQSLKDKIDRTENKLLLDALEEYGSVEKAAAGLGIGKSTYWRKLKKLKEDSR